VKLGEIIKVLGPIPRGAASTLEREIAGYSIDSRTTREGDLFFAIRGENYDGHSFIGDAAKKGAAAAVVSQEFLDTNAAGQIDAGQIDASGIDASNIMLIPVSNTLAALQSLASAVLKEWRGREVAVQAAWGRRPRKI
jgi:UDP-N-acetylmuramoyl-tripeptide--D-alanyl-D-alanine ligase